MTEPTEPPVDHGFEIAFSVGERQADSEIYVSMAITTCGVTTAGFIMSPDMAEAMAPQLAKELISAAKEARKRQRAKTGIAVVGALPDALRNREGR